LVVTGLEAVELQAAIVGGLSALFVALAGGLVSYMASQQLNRRNGQLNRIDRQLSYLYGPLLAISGANRRAYQTLLAMHRGGAEKFFDPGLPDPSEAELQLWRLWVESVFQPGNKRMYEIIVEHADLLVDDGMPAVLLEFCAHVSSWDVTIQRWAAGDFATYWAGVPHPGESLEQYVQETFQDIKSQQEELLRLTGARGPIPWIRKLAGSH
jgi:hypothetical protein